MPSYRKKPIVIQAFQWHPHMQMSACPDWFVTAVRRMNVIIDNETLSIRTLEGMMQAKPSDYILKGVENEIYPCREDIFLKTYELVVE